MTAGPSDNQSAISSTSYHGTTSTNSAQQPLLGEASLATACQTFGFDFAEVWKRDSITGTRFSCVKQYTAPPPDNQDPGCLPENEPVARGVRPFSLSKLLCCRGMKGKMSQWYTPSKPDTPLHEEVPMINTAVVAPILDYETQTDFCVLFFAYDKIEGSPAKLAQLKPLVKEVVACVAVGEARTTTSRFRSSKSVASMNEPAAKPPPVDPLKAERTKLLRSVSDSSVGAPGISWTDLINIKYLVAEETISMYTAECRAETVLAKILKPDCKNRDLCSQEFLNEAVVMQMIDHPNIAKCKGLGAEPGFFLVLELMDGGSLSQRLGFLPRYSGAHRRTFNFKDHKKRFSDMALLQSAYQLADALRYLHDEAMPGFSILHRDLKPEHIGLKADGTLKLFGFGHAKTVPSNGSTDNKQDALTSGSNGYTAPEVIVENKYTTKADIYSYAMIVYEMATLTRPFSHYNRQAYTQEVVKGGVRPPVSKKLPPGLMDLLQACWHQDPNQRPSSKDVVNALNVLILEMDTGSATSRWSVLFRRYSL